jgi:hypothetical protein
MNGQVTAGSTHSVRADLVAVAVGPRPSELGVPERAVADAEPVWVVHRQSGPPLAVVALEPDLEGLRTATARAVRAC